MMPDISGFDVCRRLKSNSKLADIPVLMLTALSDSNTAVEAFAAGAADYITKPIRHEEVIARMATHLQLHRQRQQLEQALTQVKESAHREQLAHERDAMHQELIASAKWFH